MISLTLIIINLANTGAACILPKKILLASFLTKLLLNLDGTFWTYLLTNFSFKDFRDSNWWRNSSYYVCDATLSRSAYYFWQFIFHGSSAWRNIIYIFTSATYVALSMLMLKIQGFFFNILKMVKKSKGPNNKFYQIVNGKKLNRILLWCCPIKRGWKIVRKLCPLSLWL